MQDDGCLKTMPESTVIHTSAFLMMSNIFTSLEQLDIELAKSFDEFEDFIAAHDVDDQVDLMLLTLKGEGNINPI